MLVHALALHFVSIVYNFMVALCGGMTSEALAQSDRPSIDGPGLDDVRPFRSDLFHGRADVVMIG